MKFTVRNQDGELEYQSFGQVEQAWLMGFVEPSDEILEEGKTMWRRADSFPLLAKARRHGDDVWNGSWFLWVIIGVVGGTVSLTLMASKDWMLKVGGLALGFGIAIVMINVTMKAQKRRKPHGK